MCAAKYGRIILTSSIGGVYGNQRVVNYGMAKAGMVGLNNIAALEGEPEGVKSNIIIPAAVTRMADGLDTSQYPPMDPDLVAPTVGWLAHESCSVSGEMLASIGGRISRIFVSETVGAFQPSWTIEQVGERIGDIRDKDGLIDFGLHGYLEHLGYSFKVANGG
jgi:hypothetical protein